MFSPYVALMAAQQMSSRRGDWASKVDDANKDIIHLLFGLELVVARLRFTKTKVVVEWTAGYEDVAQQLVLNLMAEGHKEIVVRKAYFMSM